MSRLRTLVVLAVVGAAACTAVPADDPAGGASDGLPHSGDDYLAVGDADNAAAAFELALTKAPGDPELQEKSRTARRLAAQRHAERADFAARQGNLATAAKELAIAERFDAEAAPVKRLRGVLGTKIAAYRDTEEGKVRAKALLRDDPQAAADLLAELRRSAPYDPEIVEMLTDATRRAEADRAAQRAEEAWDAGVRTRAVEHLAVAEQGGRAVPRAAALRRRMETDLVAEAAGAKLADLRDAWRLASDAHLSQSAVDHLRDALAEALAREARSQEAAGHPATAALYELEVQRIGVRGDTRTLDRVRAERTPVLHVVPFDDATGGSVDGLRLARALRDRLALDAAGGSAPLIATSDAPPAGAALPHLVVRGTAKSLRITAGRVGRETTKVRYVAGTRDSANPEATQLDRSLASARQRLTRENDRVLAAETRLRALEALPFGTGPGGQVGTEADVAHQTRLALARAAVTEARRALQQAQQAEFDVRQQILATPATVAEPVWAERTVEVTTLMKTVELVAHVVVADGDRTLLDLDVTGADVHRETAAPAVPSAGIAEDPDDTPDDAAMAARAADRFAEAASGAVRTSVERAAASLIEEGRAAERRGDPAAAAEAYASYLLSTSEIATPERAAAARALHEILGSAPAVRTGYRPEVNR